MRAVVQRVTNARVIVGGRVVGQIGPGLFVLLGLKAGDTPKDLDWIAGKIERLRIFEDDAGLMNLSAGQVGGAICVVSQFTLYGDARKGNRPSFIEAMPVEQARAFWPQVQARFLQSGLECAFGDFQADMACELTNDGPVTIWLDSES
ncbi:MAG TPA: D-aminoacyl-tRNA deacylase [Myxococcota bacterium]|jgi:D-tyrosyl-tRNA(Tyr) deacylase|nr:D-tyrosyl-tRNA(Tyr) deacylase [Myxococcota bacterium]OQC42906.1 MAG: D-tyrosyl-tRNA(Tyr) deacylase [Deltaproteobacteria bacterium ADurb.Bin058]HHW97772.1 D-tyrosyl-tRNA(Tyr) deacylase [Oligoflexales bacterium]HOE81464.1 D-aminoacyl-tRNA deacylase [Myxococcota bacterium]HOS61002.1 D-aminoacyl-tRNA deacylase [Myxococcota bacterium]